MRAGARAPAMRQSVWTAQSTLAQLMLTVVQRLRSKSPIHLGDCSAQCEKVGCGAVEPGASMPGTSVHCMSVMRPELSKPFCEPRTPCMSRSTRMPYLRARESARSSSASAPSVQLA